MPQSSQQPLLQSKGQKRKLALVCKKVGTPSHKKTNPKCAYFVTLEISTVTKIT
jgi:hypothetical protein